ncbi:MAG: hypothetical protein M3Q55_08875 [Acidobacteriota bacterium]|nr:hypothetical protein [Acidobacteriota bacterium]
MSALLPQPTGPQLDPRTGLVTEEWKRYFQALEDSILQTSAPADAQYYVATGNVGLSNERNLGGLAAGFLKITTAAGVATPSTVPAITASDFNSPLTVSVGGTGSNLSATGGTSYVLKQTTAGAVITVGPLAVADISGLPAVVQAGTYTPASSETTNSSAYTMFEAMYTRLGDIVTVVGLVGLTVTAATLTSFSMTLPVASLGFNVGQLSGMAEVDDGGATNFFDLGRVELNGALDKPNVRWLSRMTGAVKVRYSYRYEVQ